MRVLCAVFQKKPAIGTQDTNVILCANYQMFLRIPLQRSDKSINLYANLCF
jgi:hypothetical protein